MRTLKKAVKELKEKFNNSLIEVVIEQKIIFK